MLMVQDVFDDLGFPGQAHSCVRLVKIVPVPSFVPVRLVQLVDSFQEVLVARVLEVVWYRADKSQGVVVQWQQLFS